MKGIITEVRETQRRIMHPEYILEFGRIGGRWTVWYTESAGRYRERRVYRKTNPLFMQGALGISWIIIYKMLWWLGSLGLAGPFGEVTTAIASTYPLSYFPHAAAALVVASAIGGVWGYTQTREEVQFDRETMYPPDGYWEEFRDEDS